MDFGVTYFKVQQGGQDNHHQIQQIPIYDANRIQALQQSNLVFNYQQVQQVAQAQAQHQEPPKPVIAAAATTVAQPKAATSTKSSPNRAKTMSGFIMFQSKHRNDIKAKYPNATFGQLSKIMSETWKTMPQNEKTMWREEAIKSNAINREQNRNAARQYGQKAVSNRKPSGFIVFSRAHRKKMHDSNPGISFGEASKILGQMWRSMDASEKQKWSSDASQ